MIATEPAYGSAPVVCDSFYPQWDEFMHYLYLPVVMARSNTMRWRTEGLRVPKRLSFLERVIWEAMIAEKVSPNDPSNDKYVYISARCGFATPGNPLNRPGWHADGFGSEDVNYIWSDRFPTRFATGDFGKISDDHLESAAQFDRIINVYAPIGDADSIRLHECEPNWIYRLDPSVVHSVPEIPDPGGMRRFFKISISPNKYNLLGNSHNYLFDYEWKMWSRDELRNDPAYAGGDAGPA